MQTRKAYLDAFVVSGFAASLFNGFLNPLYVSLVLSHLDVRLIAAGSFMASGLPVLVGAALGNRAVARRLSSALPLVMAAELGLAASAAALVLLDLGAYYIASMAVVGLCSSSVIYLLQKVKQRSYRTGRAAFDRRVEMADGLGFLAGSALAAAGIPVLQSVEAVAALGALQTAVVYGLFLVLRRSLPPRPAPAARAEEPPPWRVIPCAAAAAAA